MTLVTKIFLMVMKKVMLMVVASMLLATTNVEAGEKKYSQKNDVDFTLDINMDALSRFLNLKYYQEKDMETACIMLYHGVKSSGRASNKEKQCERLNKTVKRNLMTTRKVLNDKQYREYLAILNTTFANKGLDKVLYYDMLAEK